MPQQPSIVKPILTACADVRKWEGQTTGSAVLIERSPAMKYELERK